MISYLGENPYVAFLSFMPVFGSFDDFLLLVDVGISKFLFCKIHLFESMMKL